MHEPHPPHDPELWNTKAVAAVIKAEKMLWGKHNESIQAWMYEAGFSLTTLKRAHLGWQVRNAQRPAESWGTAGTDKIHLPEGITIPVIEGTTLRRIAIYRMGHAHDGDYHTVEGSAPAPLILSGNPKRLVLVRGELDALLLHQELDAQWAVAATGNLPPAALAAPLADADEVCLIAMNHEAEALGPWHHVATGVHTLESESLIALARAGGLAPWQAQLFG